MKKLVYQAVIRWGWQLNFLGYLLVLFDITFFILVFQTSLERVLLAIPLLVLNIILFPLLKQIILSFIGKRFIEFELYTKGITIKNKYLGWKDIKSISFQSGRLIYDTRFYHGFKFPAFQRIYVLDNEGKEYSAIIDIDYWSKKDRKNNNLRKLNELMMGMDRTSILSDWAQKR